MDKKVIDVVKKAYDRMSDKEKLAFGIAFGAHTGQGQMDYAGLEYIGHPVTVYLGCDTEDERIVALLHDVVEDTKVTLEDLSMFFDEKIIEALRVISHPKKYDKKQYMIDVKNNPIARKVKIEDLKTNMDRSRLESLLEWYDYRVENQYKHNLAFLLDDNEEKEDVMYVQMCNPDTIPCKDCKWSFLAGPTNYSCAQFKNKPYDVYYESKECKKYIHK